MYEFLAWLEVNKKRVAIGGGAVLVAIGLVVTVIWYKNQQEFVASEALSAIRITGSPAEAIPPGTAEKLQQLSAQYSGTAAALRAELIRAGLLFTDGKHAEAQAAFEAYQRNHPESQWVQDAVFGIAVSLDAQNKVPEAIARYEDFIRRYPTDPNADQSRLHLASLLEKSGKPAQALEQYEKITKAAAATQGGYSPAMSEAQERLRALLVKNPQLAPAPVSAPKVTPSPVTTIRSNAPIRNNAPLMLRSNLVPRVATNAPAAGAK